MGFGLLFIGYMLATLMAVNSFGSFIRIIGYSIILIASGKLGKYNRSFLWMSAASVLMIAVSALLAAADVSRFMYEQLLINSNPLGDTYRLACGYAEMALSFAFHVAMLNAIRIIAMETDVRKNATAAVRNLVFIIIYNLIYVFMLLPFEAGKYFAAPALLIYFVYIILDLVLIYSCYARICDESDVEMEQKPSRFAFVNKMRAESEQRRLDAAQKRAEYKAQRKKK